MTGIQTGAAGERLENVTARPKLLAFYRPVDDRAPGSMRKIGFKVLTEVLTIGRRSRKHVDWTLSIAIFSTMITAGLIALYVLRGSADLP
jgi:hypothetical protein